MLSVPRIAKRAGIRVPREFVELARSAALHPEPGRWSLLYRVLWRLATSEPDLLRDTADPDLRWLSRLASEATSPDAAEVVPRAAPRPVAKARRQFWKSIADPGSSGSRSTAAGAAPFVPVGAALSLPELREAVGRCRGCARCGGVPATLGTGSRQPRVVIVTAEPAPPGGRAGDDLLGQALARVGWQQSDLYSTAACKASADGPPTRGELAACVPWLRAEIGVLRPVCIVALGASAAYAMLGASFSLEALRGKVLTDTEWAPYWLATFHPAAIVAAADNPRLQQRMQEQFFADFSALAEQVPAGPVEAE
jgi:DNA polymerase